MINIFRKRKTNNEKLVDATKEYIQHIMSVTKHHKGLIVNLDDKLDSHIIAVLAKQVCKNILGVVILCDTNSSDVYERAMILSKKFGIKVITLKLWNVYDEIERLCNNELSNFINKEDLEKSEEADNNLREGVKNITLKYFADRVNYSVIDIDVSYDKKKTEELAKYLGI